MLDELAEARHRSVLEVQGAFTEESGDRPHRLDGWVYFQPYLVQGSFCLMQASFMTGIGREDGYNWRVERFAYWGWLASTESDCEITDRSQVPDSAVQSSDPIPESDMSYILINSDELLLLVYEIVAAATEIPESARERILRYRTNTSYRLERIGLTEQSSPESGFAYSARYRVASEREGPTVVFSVTPSGFVIHGVSIWTA